LPFVTTTTSTVRLNWGTHYEVTVLDLALPAAASR